MRITSLAIILLAIVVSACGAQKQAAQTVEITLTEFGIQSPLSTFQVGQPYHFVITNAGALNHEFTIIPTNADGQMDTDMEGHDMGNMGHDMGDMGHNMSGAMLHIGEDQLPPGAIISLDYTFTEPISFGEMEFACHLPAHYEAGMFMSITVES